MMVPRPVVRSSGPIHSPRPPPAPEREAATEEERNHGRDGKKTKEEEPAATGPGSPSAPTWSFRTDPAHQPDAPAREGRNEVPRWRVGLVAGRPHQPDAPAREGRN